MRRKRKGKGNIMGKEMNGEVKIGRIRGKKEV